MREKYVALKGGLDQSESPLEVYPGSLRDSLNYYEDINGGYSRIGGYERFDGQDAPSAGAYYLARFDSWDTHVTDITAASTITVDSTIEMRVLSIDTASEADTLVAVVTAIDESTIPSDLDTTPLDWDGVSSLVSLSKNSATTDAAHEANLEAAWDYLRGQIGAVPGDAALPGCLQIGDTVVAFRSTSTDPRVYYSGATGWTRGKLGRVCEVENYTAGNTLPGETIESGAYEILAVTAWYNASTGVEDVTKAWFVVAPTGAEGDPATGTGLASSGAVGTFDIVDVIQPINAWGSFIDYVNSNFLSDPDDLAAWFCDGTNLAMCYSDRLKTVVPISENFNSLSGKKATKIAVIEDQLVYSTGEGTFVISEPGLPFNYGGAYGSAEIGVGGLITALKDADGENLVVYTDRYAKKLTGTDTSNFKFKTIQGSSGAAAQGVQLLDDLYAISARGITQLQRTETIGGYYGGSVSTSVSQLISSLSPKTTTSTVLPAKEQVRWYFSDAYFLCMTRVPTREGIRFGFTLCHYPDKPVNNVCTEIWSTGTERTFFTSDDGYVYEADVGTNFDGDPIYSLLDLHDNHLGSPGSNKLFRKIFVEGKSDDYAQVTFGHRLNYGEKQFETGTLTFQGGLSLFDEGVFDEATFDGALRERNRALLKGKGYNIGLTFDHSSKFAGPFNITGYTIHYSLLGKAKR